jgi:hypothetical protein
MLSLFLFFLVGTCQGAMIRLAPNATQWKMTPAKVYAQSTGSRLPISFTIEALPLSDQLHVYQVSVTTVPSSVGMDWCNVDYDNTTGAPIAATCLPSQTSAGVAIPSVTVVDAGELKTWTADAMAMLQLTLSTGANIGVGLGLISGVSVLLSIVLVLAFRG